MSQVKQFKSNEIHDKNIMYALIPKFQPDQEVFFLLDNKVNKSIVESINLPKIWLTARTKPKEIQISETEYKLVGNSKLFYENRLFASKEALLKSL